MLTTSTGPSYGLATYDTPRQARRADRTRKLTRRSPRWFPPVRAVGRTPSTPGSRLRRNRTASRRPGLHTPFARPPAWRDATSERLNGIPSPLRAPVGALQRRRWPASDPRCKLIGPEGAELCPHSLTASLPQRVGRAGRECGAAAPLPSPVTSSQRDPHAAPDDRSATDAGAGEPGRAC